MTKNPSRSAVRPLRRRRPTRATKLTVALPEPAEEHESAAEGPAGPPPAPDPLREMTQGIDVPLAVELEKALEGTLARFELEHGALVRKACDVPDSHMDLRDVVWCTFLGHVIQRLESKRGRAHIESLTTALLDQFVAARTQVAKIMGTLQ